MNTNKWMLSLALLAGVSVMVACGGGEKAEETTTTEAAPVAEEPMAEVWVAPASAKAVANPFKADAASIEKGKGIFTQYCVSCHGEDGKAEVPAGLAVKAANLVDKTPAQTDGEIHWKLLNGKGAMLKISTYGISDEDGWHLINYVRTLAAQG
ncbi:MAG: c-type cytochrome [Sphingobacteriaceae bacterium]|nr:c-type cytochrome [Sphingobacteriaceae bacterium]